MIKSNLPVILLKDLIILPYQEVRIEINNEISKKVVEVAKNFHNDEILIVTPINTLEENPDTSDLPKMGVVGKIKSKIDLQNGNSRIVIVGIRRVKVISYVNYSDYDDILESIISNLNSNVEDEILETAILRKLTNQLNNYITINSFISNSIMSQIKDITELDKLTDMVANFLPLNFEKKLPLMLDNNPISRGKYLIREINIETAIINLEERLDNELKNILSKSEKEFVLREKIKLIKKELGEDDIKSIDINNFNEKLKNNKYPLNIKEKLGKEIRKFEITPEISPEVSVIRNYIDTLFNIPWNTFTKDELDIKKINNSLNKTHYGLEVVKERIVEYIAVKNKIKDVNTPVLCLVGPPGVGKTTLAKTIAVALKRKFIKISLGGMSDSALLNGHKRTYIGSSPGKIIDALIKTKSNNPVILLDEIDKLNRDFRGDPSGILLDILDSNENKNFVDNYIEESIDLSKILFIVTANDKENISAPLFDRLEVIDLAGYTIYEKLDIAKNHLIKRCLKNNGLKDEIKFSDKIILEIIEKYTRESGVRNLERIINKIIRKIITESNYNKEKELIKNIDFKDLNRYLASEHYYLKENTNNNRIGVVTGLGYTSYGGATLEIEVEGFSGNTENIVTGTLGETMKESVSISFSYIKSHLKDLKIKEDIFNRKSYHINAREGGIPKDGPSAGVTITTAIISYLLNKEVSSQISMTGEITLKGDVLPIGGLKEKLLAAKRNNINKVFIPYTNKREVDSFKNDVKKGLEIKFVKNYIEIYNEIFK